MSSDDFSSFSLSGTYSAQDAARLASGGGGFSSANFTDAEDSRPPSAFFEDLGGSHNPLKGIVQQAATRHILEVAPIHPSPLFGPTNWRKRLRELMLHQDEQLIGFLMKPIQDQPLLARVKKVLHRYSERQDIEPSAIRPVAALFSDISGEILIKQEIDEKLQTRGSSSYSELCSQVTCLIEMYKETGEKILETENKMISQLEEMDKIQQRIGTMFELKTNSAMKDLTLAMETYCKTAFQDLKIEDLYKQLLYLYKKSLLLRDAIQLARLGSQSSGSEPKCAICLNESVSFAIVPCGHTFCNACVKRMYTDCSICRGKIKDRLKLFFS